jgi:ArsR family transcriptional regulator, lead/cadmium/zinc/bismuth-responsive transcriptional repressor
MTIPDTTPFDADRVSAVQRRMPDETTFEHLAQIFSAMGEKTRVRILFALANEELCVHDLSLLLGVSISGVSHQLRLLRSLRLVKLRREGRYAYYSLDDHHVAMLLQMGLEHVADGAPASSAARDRQTVTMEALG